MDNVEKSKQFRIKILNSKIEKIEEKLKIIKEKYDENSAEYNFLYNENNKMLKKLQDEKNSLLLNNENKVINFNKKRNNHSILLEREKAIQQAKISFQKRNSKYDEGNKIDKEIITSKKVVLLNDNTVKVGDKIIKNGNQITNELILYCKDKYDNGNSYSNHIKSVIELLDKKNCCKHYKEILILFGLEDYKPFINSKANLISKDVKQVLFIFLQKNNLTTFIKNVTKNQLALNILLANIIADMAYIPKIKDLDFAKKHWIDIIENYLILFRNVKIFKEEYEFHTKKLCSYFKININNYDLEKSIKVINENNIYKPKELSEEERNILIEDLCNKYKFKYKILANNLLEINSGNDDYWIYENSIDIGGNLLHINKSRNGFHRQKIKLPKESKEAIIYLFDFIKKHDKYKIEIKNNVNLLFEKLSK